MVALHTITESGAALASSTFVISPQANQLGGGLNQLRRTETHAIFKMVIITAAINNRHPATPSHRWAQ
ncbi:MAG: hypothetical protein WAK48_11145 [Candidatus Acidiferrum sp.]